MNAPIYSNRKDIGRRLAYFRHKAGLTQEQVAVRINTIFDKNYKASTISEWEHGNNTLAADYMPVLAEMFSVSLEQLYGQNEEAGSPLQILLDQIRLELTDKEREQVSVFIAYLLFARQEDASANLDHSEGTD